jgi:hypothetical protein
MPRPAFQDLQYALTSHLRDPDRVPAPAGIETRRLQIYRELLLNNLVGLLGSSFPVLRKLYQANAGGDSTWRVLIRDFFIQHRARTPLFLEVPGEFLAYLRDTRGRVAGDPPFLLELAHYEWVELALSVDEQEIDDAGIARDGDLLAGRPVLSPLAWSLAYEYPVHRIRPEYQPSEPGDQPSFLVVYRNRADKVAFMEINAVTARLISLIGEARQDGTGLALLEQVAAELSHPEPAAVVAGGVALLESLRARDIVLGTRLD